MTEKNEEATSKGLLVTSSSGLITVLVRTEALFYTIDRAFT